MYPHLHFPGTNVVLEAMHLKDGIYDPNLVWHPMGIRYILIFFVSLSIMLFGVLQFSVVLPILIASLLNIILIYLLAKEMYDERIALLSAFLLAILPADIFSSTILEADIIMSTFLLAGVWFYYKFKKQRYKPYLFSLVGAFIAIALFIKVFALLILPIIFLYEIFTELKIKRLVFLGIGFLLVCSPFIIYQYVETRDPLYNIHVEQNHIYDITYIKENFEPIHQFKPDKNDYFEYLKKVFLPLPLNFKYEWHDSAKNPTFNVYFYLFVFSLFLFSKFDEKNYLLLLWFFFIFGFLEFYILIQKIQRYLLICLYPLIISISYFMFYLYRNWSIKHKKTYLVSVIILLFLISLMQLGFVTTLDQDKWNEGAENEKKYPLVFEGLPEKDIYITSYQTIPLLQFYFDYKKSYDGPYGFRGETRYKFIDLHEVQDFTEVKNSYVIVEQIYLNIEDEIRYYNKNFSKPLSIPTTWQPIFIYPDEEGHVMVGIWDVN